MQTARTLFARFARASSTLLVASLTIGLGVVGCAPEASDGEERWDEGPLAEEGESAVESVESVEPSEVGEVSAALSISGFQLPFPCNQV